MGANYKVLSNFEVATAEEAQGYFMDQAIVKVDAEADLTALPTTVKTAYVLNTGILMARDSANAWKPQGGAAAVSETEPANPQVGQLWVKPSELLPAPVRGYIISTTKAVTATTYTNVTVDTSRSLTLAKPVMCILTMQASLNGTAGTSIQARLKWTGATIGDTVTQVGGFMGALNSSVASEKVSYSTTAVLATGTTTFGVDALRSNTTNATSIDYFAITCTPVAWADEYVAGVS